MDYRRRFIENHIRDLSGTFGAVLVTGPRQAGKTWLLTQLAAEIFADEMEIVSFDTPSEIDEFRRDPDLFFANHPGPLFLDEVQHVPDLFPYLKREIDRFPGKFRFFLSGSQHFPLMKKVTESLAGRAAVLDLWPFAVQEIRDSDVKRAELTVDLLADPSLLNSMLGQEYPCNDRDDVSPSMIDGGYPSVALWNGAAPWLESYRRTYVQRDIRDLSQVGNLGLFDRFVVLCAGRTGTVINKTEAGRILGVTHKTVDHWLSLLETSYQIVQIPAHHATATKRLVRRPKWLFADSGLGLHLQAIRDGRALLNAPHFGNLFESFVIMEIRKLHGHIGRFWDARFWRTQRGLECDLVLPFAGRLTPIEIKHSAAPRRSDFTALHSFIDGEKDAADCGAVISLAPRVERLTEKVYNLPLGLLLGGP